MLNRFLFRHIDNSALLVFRVMFGLLCFLESVGAIFTGWVKRTFIDPEFTFTFIGFEWLQPLPGYGMYVYYAVMGVMALGILVGYKYRFTAITFTLMWTVTYIMQKASYNNHYYLLILISGIMAVLPAHKHLSVDAHNKPSLKAISMPNWCRVLIIAQLFIIYTYAALAKLYPDWLDGTVMNLLMSRRNIFPFIVGFLQDEAIQQILTYGGILFDGLIIPLLLYKPTRKLAFIASIIFHLFNSLVFQIGVFPYLSLAFTVFFFSPKTIHRIFLKSRKPFYSEAEIKQPNYAKVIQLGLVCYLVLQIALPIRHHFITDNVLWSEEGHRLSWRMMLRTKSGIASYVVKNHNTGEKFRVKLQDYLSPKQSAIAQTKPDIMWQFAQRLKQVYKQKGDSISVFVSARVSVNGKPIKQLTDHTVDLAATPWKPFGHQDWILPSKP